MTIQQMLEKKKEKGYTYAQIADLSRRARRTVFCSESLGFVQKGREYASIKEYR